MLSLKDWNSLPHLKRLRIARVFFFNMGEEFIQEVSEEFHHNFDYEGKDCIAGRWYKLLLSNCYKQRDGKIKVVVLIA